MSAEVRGTRSRRCRLKGCSDRVVGRRLCRLHYQAAWKAGEFVNAGPATPRKPDRKVCPAEHKHADSSTCYIQHQCRCDPCMDHHSAMENGRRKAKAYGRFDRGVVDAGPIREHMMVLAEYGIGYKQAAKIAGVGITAARTLIWGRQEPGPRNGELQKHVKRETAAKLLAVQPVLENLADRALTPARGSVRRLQALMAFGWSQAKIAAELGWMDTNLSGMRLRFERAQATGHTSRVKINASTARAIAALYDRLSVAAPPESEWRDRIAASRARNTGIQRGWPLPMDWEANDNNFDATYPVRRSIRLRDTPDQ